MTNDVICWPLRDSLTGSERFKDEIERAFRTSLGQTTKPSQPISVWPDSRVVSEV